MRICFLALAAFALLLGAAQAHDAPTSFVDLRLQRDGLQMVVTASNTDLAHGLPTVEPAMLLDPVIIVTQRNALAGLIRQGLQISADGHPLNAELREVVPVLENRDLRLTFQAAWSEVPVRLRVQCRLFPYDSRHRTFLNVYENGQLRRQEIFEGKTAPVEFEPGGQQSIGAVLAQFTSEGIRHIFTGPDHILFVIGLLLLGGEVTRLLKIATAFTVAHSITLALATFHVLRPPAAIVEPAIALSIVCVGADALIGGKGHDARLLLAFVFGLVHGFGFANTLQEMLLPRHALGWSLFAFNGGVEIAQVGIILALAPPLILLKRYSLLAWERAVTAAAFCVTGTGAFWFFERVLA